MCQTTMSAGLDNAVAVEYDQTESRYSICITPYQPQDWPMCVCVYTLHVTYTDDLLKQVHMTNQLVQAAHRQAFLAENLIYHYRLHSHNHFVYIMKQASLFSMFWSGLITD